MFDGGNELSRRRYLTAASGALGAAGLAGCGMVSGGENGGIEGTREPVCAGMSSDAAPLYDDWFLRLTPSEFTGSKLTMATADMTALARSPRLRQLSEVFLLFPLRVAERTALAGRPVERITTVRPPGEQWGAYVGFEWPGDALDRRGWLADFKLSFGSKPDDKGRTGGAHATFEEVDEKYGYQRIRVGNVPMTKLLAYDDEHVVVFPEAYGPVEATVGTRFERLVDTRRDESRPFHCRHRDARTLVERLPTNDLAFAWVRTDGGTFGSTDRVPAGARASGFTFRLETGSGGETPDGAGADESDEPLVRIEQTVVYPAGEASVDAVVDYVRANRWDSGGQTGILFSDPEFDRSGRVVRVTERRPVASLF